MTFLGTIPNPLRSIIKEAAKGWPRGDVFVACCGNFTIERTLRDADPAFTPRSNDVSIYTTALGRWLSGEPVELSLSEEYADTLEWVAPYLDGGVGSVAAIMLSTHFAAELGSDHPWKRRTVEAHQRQFADMHAATVEKLQANRFPVKTFDCMDVREWLDTEVPEDATICSFPPFYKGGYEKLYERLEEIFDWPRPTYEILDDDGLQDVVRKITDRPRWLIGRNVREPHLEEHLVGYVQPTPTAAPFYVYAKGEKQTTRFVIPRDQYAPVLAPRLTRGEEIGDRLTLAPITTPQYRTLRAQYLNPRIAAGNVKYPFAVLVDGKVIGVVAFGLWTPNVPDELMLAADFAVAPHDYPKLSKLVVMAAQSVEAQRFLDRAWARRVRSLQTAVFTNNPVSMKYRGLFELRDRVDAPEGSPFKHKLTYLSPAGRWTLDEALAEWKRRWGQRKPTTTTEEKP